MDNLTNQVNIVATTQIGERQASSVSANERSMPLARALPVPLRAQPTASPQRVRHRSHGNFRIREGAARCWLLLVKANTVEAGTVNMNSIVSIAFGFGTLVLTWPSPFSSCSCGLAAAPPPPHRPPPQ